MRRASGIVSTTLVMFTIALSALCRDAGAEAPWRFERSYLAGTRDVNGRFMGGTETMRLVAHREMLFAGISYWTDRPDQLTDAPWPGAQTIVTKGPESEWVLDATTC